MLFTRGGLRPGQTVMINSVGSGIGSAAVQLAHLAGATVIGTSSRDEKLEQARAAGMDHGINYSRQNVVEEAMQLTDGKGVDLVSEPVGGEAFQWGLDSLTKDGRLVTCGAHSGEVVPFDIIPFFRTQKSIIGSFVYTRQEVEICLDLAARGKITPQVHATFALGQAAAAMDLAPSAGLARPSTTVTGRSASSDAAATMASGATPATSSSASVGARRARMRASAWPG